MQTGDPSNYSFPSTHRSNAQKPNILVILTDQQSATMMTCTGNHDLDTPAMDWLSDNGVRFERAYATNPVCLPSRFSLQTGCYPSEVGIRTNSDGADAEPFSDFRNRTLGHRIRQAGYETAYGGKVHLPKGTGMGDVRKLGYDNISPHDARDGLAQACASFIKQDRNSPFFLFASFVNPHDICYMAINDYNRQQGKAPGDNTDSQICEKLLAQAPSEQKDLPEIQQGNTLENAVGKDQPKAVEAFLKQRPFKYYVHTQWDEKKWRLHRWLYARLTERVDRQIGTVLEALEDSGQLENTVIIFTSDHGDVDGAHRMEHKTVFYEEALRVPFVVTQKNQTPTFVDTDHLINNGLDLFPTVCSYAGINPPDGLSGRNVRPLAEGNPPSEWRDECIIESEIGTYMITTEWKYCRLDFAGEEEALFHMTEDPHEMTNLASDPAYHDKLVECRKRFEACRVGT